MSAQTEIQFQLANFVRAAESFDLTCIVYDAMPHGGWQAVRRNVEDHVAALADDAMEADQGLTMYDAIAVAMDGSVVIAVDPNGSRFLGAWVSPTEWFLGSDVIEDQDAAMRKLRGY